jgi:hypothetical protein
MQRVDFKKNVFVMDLNNCDMIFGVQWLIMFDNIVSNYKEL